MTISAWKNATEEKDRLEHVADWYNPREDFDRHYVAYESELILRDAKGPAVIETGCATGLLTERLARHFEKYVVVDGSQTYIEAARRMVPNHVDFRLSLFEEFEPGEKFNNIIMGQMLEHVADPIALLRRAQTWLAGDGTIHITVPNATSLHRRIGKRKGLIKNLDELNERDLRLGHRRVYSFASLRQDAEQAGLRVIRREGIFLKPLSNAQVESWPAWLLRTLFFLGKYVPSYCGLIYVVCAPNLEQEVR